MSKTKVLKEVVYGFGLAAVVSGCNGTLRMSTHECSGRYTEGIGVLFSHNLLELKRGDTTFSMIEYDGRNVDWRVIGEEKRVGSKLINKITVNTGTFSESFTPLDSNSVTTSGVRAKYWINRGTEMYRKALDCFINWARRDDAKHHIPR